MDSKKIAAAVAQNTELSLKKEREFKVQQFLLLLTAVVYPLFGYINIYVLQPAIETKEIFIQRFVFSGLIAIALAAAQFSNYLKKYFYTVIVIFTYLGIGHLLYIASVIGFKTPHFVGIIMVLFGTSLVYKRKVDLNLYLIFNFVSCSLAAVYSPPSDIAAPLTILVYGTICLVISIAINSKISAERSLRHNESNLNALIENTSDMIWSIDNNYRLLTANRAYLELRKSYTGKYPEIGKEVKLDDYPEKIRNEWKVYYNRALKGESFTVESNYYYEDKLFYVEHSFNPITNASGKTKGVSIFTRDITENVLKQRKIEDLLKLAEEKSALLLSKQSQLEAIKDSSPIGIFVTDTAGSCTYTNVAYQKTVGLSAEECLGIGWIRALYEEDKSLVLQAWNSFVHENAPFDLEYRFKHKNESIRWASVQANHIFNDGELLGYVGMVTDVTIKKEITKRLIEAQEIAQLGSWEFFPTTGELYWSKEHYDIFEINENVKDKLYENYRSKIHPEDIPRLDEVVRDAVEQGKNFSYEHRAVMEDGRIKHVLGLGKVVKNNKGETLKITGTVQDISERHILHQENSLLKELIDQSPDRVTVIDSNGQYIYANKMAIKSFKIPANKLSSLNAKEIVPEFKNNPTLFAEKLKELREKKQSVAERTIITKDGTNLEIEVSAHFLKHQSKEYIISFSRDVTDRKKLLKAKEEAEFKGKLKEEFLANMSHEIRTPLNAIVGLGNLLQKSNDTSKQKEYIDYINLNAKNLIGIVNDILDFSKIESGNMQIEKEPFVLKKCLQEVSSAMEQHIKANNIKFNITLSENLPNTVVGDEVKLKQILTNLLSNANKFTKYGGITLSADCLLKNDKNCLVKFVVEDTGIGIPEDKIDSIFQSFTQASTDTTRKYGGTGLGLTIVKKMVELQDGKIEVSSSVGKGSAFIVHLPFEISNDLSKQKESNETLVSHLKVLLVEDNAFNQMVVIDTLKECNDTIVIETAENGEEALQKVKENKYDLIIMDIQMPVLDGHATTAIMRKELHLNTPILGMSAHSETLEIENCLKNGMNDYITKPFEQQILINKIHSLVTNIANK